MPGRSKALLGSRGYGYVAPEGWRGDAVYTFAPTAVRSHIHTTSKKGLSAVWHNVGYIINSNVSILPYTHHIKVRLFKEPARAEYHRLVHLQLYGFSLCLGDHLKKIQ